MPITFTSGLTPTFPENSFNSEKTHVKQLGVDLIAGTAFKNPLASVLTTMLARVDAVSTLLEEDRVIASAEAVTMNSYVSGTLPTGFSTAGYNDANMTSIANTATAYATANTATQAKLLTFKNYFTTADTDNFKLHNELLCGLDDAPPAGIEKPTLVVLMGMARSITDIENLHGIAFTNYLTGLFGALFTGDTTVANAQTHLNTDPIPTTYDSLNIVTAVNANPFSTNPAAVIGTIDPVTSSVTTYGTNVDTHKGNFTTHITTDMAYYNTVLAKIKSYIQSYQISGHIQDPYYRFMYTDVYGHDDIQQTITDFTNGDIT
mgnify:CR=1 FL=1